MSREIKFRAWAGGKMWYQGSVEFQQVGETIFGSRSKFILWEFDGIESGENLFAPIDLDSEIPQLMQFTGLKDKNGREIYEGDILTAEGYPWFDDGAPNYRAVVEYGTDAMFLAVKVCINPAKRGISHGIAESLGEIEGWEIIGNIHENPGMESNPSRESK